MKQFFYFILALFSLALTSCGKTWVTTQSENCSLYRNKNTFIDWEGDTLSAGDFSVPYGNGVLSHKEKNEIVQDNHFFSYTEPSGYFKCIYSSTLFDDYYLGEFSHYFTKRIPNGRGILIRKTKEEKSSTITYIGTFVKGAPEGSCVRLDNGKKTYEGGFVKGKANGYGKLFRDDDIFFEGQFVDGQRFGEGVEYQDKYILSGTWENNKKNGVFSIDRVSNGTQSIVNFIDDIPNLEKGNVIYSNGYVWEGPLTDKFEPTGHGTFSKEETINIYDLNKGKASGELSIKFPDGASYIGNTNKGKRNGYGIQTYSSGITYSGNWINDLKSGYGELYIDDDWYYSGDWKNDLYDGYGSFNFPDYLYEGNWKSGKKDGYGTLTLSNLYYEGYWHNDELDGDGYLSFQDGSYYEGNWKNNKRNGYGEYVWADGSSYYGNWTDDLPDGEGEIIFSNGDFYFGELEYGYFSGAGEYLFANGDRYEGTFVGNDRTGLGLYYFADGNSYEGQFQNNLPNGKGRFYFENGIFYEGNFENGKIKGEGSLFIPEEEDYTIITSSDWSENLIPTTGYVLFANGDEFFGTLKNGMPTENGSWTTREERLNNKTNSQKLRDFYDSHQKTIEKTFTITEWVITGINAAATIAEFIPIPPVQVVAMAVDKSCDVASCVISGTNIAIKTGVLNYDVNEIKQNGGSEEDIAALKKQYEKEISGDVINISITVGLAGTQAVRSGVKAKKAVEMYPKLAKLSKTVESTGQLAKTAKTGKFTDKLVRGTVSITYGKTGAKLVKTYGDDAAKLLFKYGDNAKYALSEAGETVLKISKRGGEKALKVVFDNGEDAIKILEKNLKNIDEITDLIAKKGKAGIRLLEVAGDSAADVAKQISKHGDDYFEIARKLGSRNIQKLTKITSRYGDDAIEPLLKVQKEDPKKITKAFQYIEAKGLDGIYDLKKWDGKIPDHITSATIRLAKKRYKGAVKAATDAMLKLPALKLSRKEMDMIRKNPEYLYELVKKYTGKSFKDGYKEFFIRMSKKNKNQIVEIWNYSADARNVVKGAIRNGGGNHEWLMCESFCSFLTDPKWGKDGPYLANIIDQLVTDTSTVIMSNGWSHANECLITLGNSKNPRSVIHNGIRQIMKESNDADELLIKLRKWVSDNFTQEACDAFEEAYQLCIN